MEHKIVNKKLTLEIIKLLHKMGFPTHLKGYRYLRCAIEKTYYNQSYLDNITKSLYPAIAREHRTTSTRVDRDIRHAIEVAVKRNKDRIIQEFGEAMFYEKHKPSNAECIAMMVDILYLNQEEN